MMPRRYTCSRGALVGMLCAVLGACPTDPEPGEDAGATPDPTAPAVVVTASPSSGDTPLTVSFDADITLFRGAAVSSLVWDLGDGTSSLAERPTKVFDQAGSFTVTCTVGDSNGLEGSGSVTVEVTEGPPAEYVGSSRCRTCHMAEHATWDESGHSSALVGVQGSAPLYPFSQITATPSGTTWHDLTYVVGGHGWSAAFLDASGQLITGPAAQYVLATESLEQLEGDTPGARDFDCGVCHATGWSPLSENGGQHQDGLSGIAGTWAEPGVGCEACHGAGSHHVTDPRTTNIRRGNSTETCRPCHSRGQDRVLIEDGLLLSYQQVDEHVKNHHGVDHLPCSDCHDAHATSVHDDQTSYDAIVTSCRYCHPGTRFDVSGPMAGNACVDCHMPRVVRSASSSGDGLHLRGDLRSHIFSMDVDGVTVAEQTETDGTSTWLVEDERGLVDLNLAWACMGCHDGTTAHEMTDYTEAVARVPTIHADP